MSIDDDSAAPPDGTAHFTIEIRYCDDRVEGIATRQGASGPAAFSGWLELLRLLEVPTATEQVLPTPGNG